MSNNKWSFKAETHNDLNGTGDYYSTVQFIGSNDILQTTGEEIDDDDCQKFCDLLNLMPDLWSYRCDYAEFFLSQNEKENIILKELLIKLKSENLVSKVGQEYIDDCFSKLIL